MSLFKEKVSMNRGVAFMLLTAFIQSLILTMVKFTGPSTSVGVQMLGYYLIPLMILLPLCFIKKGNPVQTTHLSMHVLRGFFSSVSVCCFFYAIEVMPLGISSTLFNTIPLFVSLIAVFALGESFSLGLIAGLSSATLGVFCIINPRVELFSALHVCIGLSAALMMALSTIFLRILARRGERVINIVFWQYVFCSIFSMFVVAYEAHLEIQPNSTLGQSALVFLLALLGCASLLAQYTFSKAATYLPASRLAPYFYASVPLSSIVGFIVWGQALSPMMVLGSVLIFLGLCFCVFEKKTKLLTR